MAKVLSDYVEKDEALLEKGVGICASTCMRHQSAKQGNGAAVMHIHQSQSAQEPRSVNTTRTAQPTGIQLFKKELAVEAIYHQKVLAL